MPKERARWRKREILFPIATIHAFVIIGPPNYVELQQPPSILVLTPPSRDFLTEPGATTRSCQTHSYINAWSLWLSSPEENPWGVCMSRSPIGPVFTSFRPALGRSVYSSVHSQFLWHLKQWRGVSRYLKHFINNKYSHRLSILTMCHLNPSHFQLWKAQI